MSTPNIENCLRQAQAITGEPNEFLMVRELVTSLTELVAYLKMVEAQP